MLELVDVTRRVAGETHIHPTTLTLEPGRFNMLLGTTLSGKTSLMQLMAGLERPSSGQIRFHGQDVTGVSVRKRNVSMVYQQFINYPNMTVFENVASPLRVAGKRETEIRERVGAIAELLRISELLDRRPAELSGGQQQRTAMARALVKDSDLILLDEPLANLDFKLREELRDELPKLFGTRDCVVVYSTTEPTEALLFGGRTAALHEGRVVGFGETGDIYRRPQTLIAAQVFSDPPINTVEAVCNNGLMRLDGGVQWPAGLPDGRYTVAIRAHLITPVQPSRPAVEIEGTVTVAELSGSESMIHFEAFGRDWVSLSHGVHPFRVGEKARLHADFAAALYFDDKGRRVDPVAGSG